MNNIEEDLPSKFSKVKTKTYLLCSIYLAVLISGTGFLSYNYISKSKDEIQTVHSKRDALKIRLDQMIYDYNKADGYQKIRLNEQGYIEYYDIKVKQNPPVAEPVVQLAANVIATPQEVSVSTKSPSVSLEDHFDTEITPSQYAEINNVVEHTKNEDFKKVVAGMMKDGKITNAEYSEISIPLALLLGEVELSKAKEDLNKNLK